MTTIHLDSKMVPAAMRGAYAGNMFKAHVCETVTIPMDAGLWSGGSRNTYYAIKLDTGEQVAFPGQQSAPWDRSRTVREVKLEPGFAVVEHSIFCGKDTGLTFYVHPANATKLLPPAVELNEHEKMVLKATKSFKSSYGGKDRYQMMQDESRHYGAMCVQPAFPTRNEWDAAKQSLISRGLLNKAGAITVAGRNAVPSRY